MIEKTSTTPHGLSDWKEQLKRLLLPADPVVKVTALQKLKAKTGNAKNVATILKEDPALCLVLMHEVNRTLNRSDNETHSLSHTISLLGFPYVETLLKRTPDYDKKSFTYLPQYRQQLSVSIHAAYQAQRWAEKNAHWPSGELFWATLFQRSSHWALWYSAGDKMMQLQRARARAGGAQQSEFEMQIFGCRLRDLSRALSRSWHLPKTTQGSWQEALRGSERQWISLSKIDFEHIVLAMEESPDLLRVSSSPCFAIALANQLADDSEWNWYSSQTLRLQKILATAMRMDSDQAIAMSHKIAIDATKMCGINNTLKPAIQLFSYIDKASELNSDANTSPRVEATPTRTTTTKATTTNQHLLAGAPSTLIDSIKRLKHHPETFGNRQEIMKLTVNTLCQSVDCSRAIVFLLNRGSKELRNFCDSGCDNSPELKGFRHRLERGDLFNKMLQKPALVRLQKNNRDKIWPLLPRDFQIACHPEEFLMMSLFNGDKPIAIVYADCADSPDNFDQSKTDYFKTLCSATSLCLQNQSSS